MFVVAKTATRVQLGAIQIKGRQSLKTLKTNVWQSTNMYIHVNDKKFYSVRYDCRNLKFFMQYPCVLLFVKILHHLFFKYFLGYFLFVKKINSTQRLLNNKHSSQLLLPNVHLA